MTTLKSECRKFSPNIFNKSKCQNCFRTKDAHSAEALESNRATRKVSKCGYLFVAPDWDFSVSINRTKRWQRRWFVLYDDGELTYSVDEHPDTVPQAVIDMNKVLEVSDAQEVTGNQFAIAVTAPEKVHFVKGTSREESKWWFDVLVRIPRNTIRGKHKRNATFPGGKATTTPVAIIPDHEPSDKDGPSESVSRPRFLSTCEPRNRRDWNWLQIDPNDEDVFPTKDNSNNPNYDENSSPESQLTTDQRNSRLSTDVDVNNALNKLITSTVSLNNSNNNNGRTVLQTKLQDNKSTENEVINNEDESKESKEKKENSDTPETVKKGRSRRYLKRENRGSRSQRSRSDGVAKMIPGKDSLVDEILSGSKAFHHNPVYLLLSDTANSSLLSKKMEDVIKPNGALSPVPTRRRHTSDKDSFLKYRSVIEGKSETHLPSRPLKKSESLMNIASESAAEMRNRLSELKRNHSYKGSPALYYRDRQSDTYHQSSKMTSAFINAIRPVRDTDPKLNNQNDVDKGSDSTVANPSWESGVDICTEDMFLKKGWLMRQTLSKEWSRHWFVLKNSSLTYYRDPSAEDCGILDGVLDLNQVTSIEEFDSDKKFAFCLIMWDNKKHVLSAVTAGIRGSWIQAIQHASDLWDLASRKDFSKDEIVLPEHSFHSTDAKVNDKCQNQISASSSPVPSPEAEKLLDLSSSDDQSEYFSIIDDDDDGGEGSSSPRPLPPSPPVTRTPMSLVKERARTRSNSYSQPTRQSSFSSGTDCSEPRIEQHSDGTNSDHSSTCAQDSPLWQRKKYYQDICAKLMENQFQLDSNTKNSQFLKENLTSSIHKDSSKSSKDEINGTYQMKILQERCKDLENQLAIKEKEVEDKTLELDAFGILKSTYHSLIEQHKSLKKQITEGKEAVVAGQNELSDSYQLKYELLKAKYIQDRTEWENKVKKEKLSGSRENNCEGFVKILQKTKQTLNELKDKFRESEGNCDDKSIRWKEIHQLCEEIEKVSPSLERKLKRENEIKKLRKALCELQLLCNKKQQKLEEVQGNYASLNLEVEKRDLKIQELQHQLQTSKEDCLSSLLTKPPSQEDFTVTSNDSVEELPDVETDLGDHCQQLKSKFDLAREQIRKLKKEVKESHANYDDLEIVCFKLKQELKVKHENHQSQIALMTARVDDLTSKFTLSEKNFRQLKQKMMKVESKQERRRSSLKNKEVLTLSKECEAKLFELERKIFTIENELKEEKQTSGNDEPPSIPVDSQIEGDDNSLSSERHLQKRLSQDSTNGSENTGLLLRLHTLGVRVKSASETVEKQADGSAKEDGSLEKPKICLQVRTDEEENSVQEEGGEDWSTLSYATSLADLQAIDGLDGEFPCSWSECLECLDQKVESLLLWVKNAVQLVQKQEASAVGNAKGCYAVNKDAISLASDVIESLDNLPTAKMEETTGAMSRFDTIKLCYKMLLLNEAARILQKIMSSESKITLEKFSVSDIAFKVINEHLYQVTAWGNCEDKSHSDINSCASLVEKLISMCSIDFDSFQSESEDFAQSSQQPPDRLLLVQEHCTQLTKLLDTARESRFSTLWHMLTDVPVQDADVINQNSSSLNEALQEMDPLLSNLIVMVNQVFETTERELCAPQYQNLSLLQCEHESWNCWCLHTCKILKLEQQLLVDELKKLCPRVNEGNLFSSGFNDAVYQKIVFTVSELAQIVMSRTITQSILSFIVDHRNNVYSDSYKQWISHLHENYYRKALLLAQGEIFAQNFNKFSDNATLKNILNLGAREIKMAEEIEAVHHLHQRNLETLQTEMESLCEENKRLISKNCLKCEEVTLEFHRFKEEIKQKSKEQNCCQQCFTYKTQIQSVTEKHEVEMFSLHKQYKEKIDELHKHLQLVLQQKDEIHLQEVQKLEEDLQVAHKRLNHLEIEYDEQIQSLRELYEQKMSLKQDPINEESVRRRYQTEIDQLKGLCEKGLVAMENSHRRITLELEKRHKQELTILEAEKEKVLAEETQATLTALEVMRKAHADELQREIARFKEEFAKKMQSDYQSETFYQKHGSELEEIKREILSISEKYSVKCLERASLEERVEVLCHQLQETNHQLFDLMARNKQLKVHLAMDIAQKKDAVEGKEDSQFAEDLKMLLKLKESELAENREENAQLKQELHLAQMHVSVLDVQCEQLDQSLKAERRLREDEVSSLRTKLDAIISASSVVGEESLQSTDRSYRGSNMSSRRGFLYRSPSLNLPGHLLEIASRRILTTPSSTKELLRSPSCPGLQNPAPS